MLQIDIYSILLSVIAYTNSYETICGTSLTLDLWPLHYLWSTWWWVWGYQWMESSGPHSPLSQMYTRHGNEVEHWSLEELWKQMKCLQLQSALFSFILLTPCIPLCLNTFYFPGKEKMFQLKVEKKLILWYSDSALNHPSAQVLLCW